MSPEATAFLIGASTGGLVVAVVALQLHVKRVRELWCVWMEGRG